MTGMVEAVVAYTLLSSLLATYVVRQIVLLNGLTSKLGESSSRGPEADSD
ncbi:MAG: hypothetical protein QGF28_05020 [Candidatus Thalassarchaeaceae archaeon]|jgi:hypothetical protein|nr:hypothetical protein [Candidatus Thalassarchaeaceae archaeon]MDP7091423.1 hypothetical protein [Candidatus Thalassarchaeaceae archaeon]MDP7257278.1 hypothetical protein [Candidatus Thalassarchaeaceae archaeon]MDP7446542.1 hypothetical protein [Candidatus Thalassarchaeaceae archaeon]MDP7648617.1 hypothetical protein [Candidatus Thalassarchaeaceae archaeon]